MAQFLNKGDHILIPFGMFGMSLGYKGPHIYKSLKTAMKNYGKDADEVVEYAPIVKCGAFTGLRTSPRTRFGCRKKKEENKVWITKIRKPR